jgi:hypothetical protein
VSSSKIFKWKQVILSRGTEVFRKGFGFEAPKDMDLEKLDATIGRLKVENDFLAKFGRAKAMKERRGHLMALHPELSKRCKAQLLKVNLSSCYVKPKPVSGG